MESENVEVKNENEVIEQPKRKVGRPRKYASDKERNDANHKRRGEIDRAFTALKRTLRKEELTAQLDLIHILSTEKLEDSLAKSMLELYTASKTVSDSNQNQTSN